MITSSDEAKACSEQHRKPCHDCPMRRKALPGWLGGSTAQEYRQLAHSDAEVPCHTKLGLHCAGMAIYRANVVKRATFRLPEDHVEVFSTPLEFIDHHEGGFK